MKAQDRILVAIDTNDVQKALVLVGNVSDFVGGFKVGLEFFTSTYAQMVAKRDHWLLDRLHELFYDISGKVFWDGKWDDIPNTVGGAAMGVQPLRPKFINVHASSGINAIAQAVQNRGQSLVLGVTVLTSIDPDECRSIFGDSPDDTVLRFARKLVEAKADGIICSPKELAFLQNRMEPEVFSSLKKVIPGIRPEWAQNNDQKRTMTPAEAVQAGADYLVIGRPISSPPIEIGSPATAARRIAEEIESVL